MIEESALKLLNGDGVISGVTALADCSTVISVPPRRTIERIRGKAATVSKYSSTRPAKTKSTGAIAR